MTREQVIKGLECCANLDGGACAVCDWADPEEYECFTNLAKAALELLKAQEAIPHKNYANANMWWCKCGWYLGKRGTLNYCPHCGRKVKWDD